MEGYIPYREERNLMRKLLILLCICILSIVLVSCGSSASDEPAVTADYDSVHDAALAHRNGENIVGKTVKVEVAENSAGVIYYGPDKEVNANLYMTIITDDNNREEVLGIKEGDTVVVTIDSVDDHLEYSIYLFAKKYEIY